LYRIIINIILHKIIIKRRINPLLEYENSTFKDKIKRRKAEILLFKKKVLFLKYLMPNIIERIPMKLKREKKL